MEITYYGADVVEFISSRTIRNPSVLTMSSTRTWRRMIVMYILFFSNNIVVMNTQRSVCWPMDSSVFISLISTCSHSKTEETMKEKCENPDYFHREVSDYIPMYHEIGQEVYRNKYCALCNKVSLKQLVQPKLKVRCRNPLRLPSERVNHSNIELMIFKKECTFAITDVRLRSLSCSISEKNCKNKERSNTETTFGYLETNTTKQWYRFPDRECCEEFYTSCVTFIGMRSRLFYYSLRAILYGQNKIIDEPYNFSTLLTTSDNSTRPHTNWFLSLNIITTIVVLSSSIVLVILYSIIKTLYTPTTFMVVTIGVNIACLETVNLLISFLCSFCGVSACEYLSLASIYLHISETVCIAIYIDSFWTDVKKMKHYQNQTDSVRDRKRYIQFFCPCLMVPFSLCSALLLYNKYYLWGPQANLKIYSCQIFKVMGLVYFYIVPTLIVLIYTAIVCVKVCAYLKKYVPRNHNCALVGKDNGNVVIGIKLCSISGMTWVLNLIMSIFPNKTIVEVGVILSHFNGFVIVICFLSCKAIKNLINR